MAHHARNTNRPPRRHHEIDRARRTTRPRPSGLDLVDRNPRERSLSWFSL